MTRKSAPGMRKVPSQDRARFTVAAILEATGLLAAENGRRLTTNHIAQRAGLSIGSLYQYFPNKEAIVLALAAAERERIAVALRQTLAESAGAEPDGAARDGAEGDGAAGFEASVRTVVETLVGLTAGSRRASRKLEMDALRREVAQSIAPQLDRLGEALVARWQADRGARARPLSDAEAFVLSRAIVGLLRSATLEGSAITDRPGFVDALVDLVVGYLDRLGERPSGA